VPDNLPPVLTRASPKADAIRYLIAGHFDISDEGKVSIQEHQHLREWHDCICWRRATSTGTCAGWAMKPVILSAAADFDYDEMATTVATDFAEQCHGPHLLFLQDLMPLAEIKPSVPTALSVVILPLLTVRATRGGTPAPRMPGISYVAKRGGLLQQWMLRCG
jgi:hypothetical protein